MTPHRHFPLPFSLAAPCAFIALCLTLFFYAPPLFAASKGGRVPTTIESDKMEYDANKQTVIFLGKVYVKRPDMEIWADKMTVFLDKSGKKRSNTPSETQGMDAGDIDRIVAEKNVKMKSGDKTGTCQKATYFAKEDKFVMEGNPVLKDGKESTIAGHMLVHYPSSNQSQVLRGKVTFYAPDSKSDRSPLSPGLKKGKN